MIDVNVSLFHWPTRRLPRDDTTRLVANLRESGVTQAWAGSFEGLLHHDVAGVNHRLADECTKRGEGLLVPIGTVNPQLPDWEDDLRRCTALHQMRAIRLYPNYHGYDLQSPAFVRLLERAAAERTLVQIMARSEDPRTQHRLLQVPDVDLRPLKTLIPQVRDLRLLLSNSQPACPPELQTEFVRTGQVFFDIAMLEGAEGLTRFLKSVPPDRILFGSHAPFFAWKSAALKLKESLLPQAVLDQIRETNAANLWSLLGARSL